MRGGLTAGVVLCVSKSGGSDMGGKGAGDVVKKQKRTGHRKRGQPEKIASAPRTEGTSERRRQSVKLSLRSGKGEQRAVTAHGVRARRYRMFALVFAAVLGRRRRRWCCVVVFDDLRRNEEKCEVVAAACRRFRDG